MIGVTRVHAVGLTMLSLLAAPLARAEDYPARSVRIVTSEIGAGGDFTARAISQGLSAALGQPFVVDNRGGGVIAGEFVARAPADGYTLLVYGNTLWLLPLMRSHIPYDTLRDFVPVSLGSRSANILAVHPSLPVRSVTELVRFAQARPGQLNYGSAAAGTTSHMGAELLKYVAKINVVRVPFRGAASALNAMLSGQVHLIFMGGATAVAQVESKRVRVLAVAASESSPVFPGVPTMAAAGLPGVEFTALSGVFAPARTPQAIVNQLSQDITRALQRPEVKSRFNAVASEAVGSTPEAFASAIRDEINRFDAVIRSAGIRDE
jgi:tripartite-type tricarboxylate transporter receptor subunit TctC